MPQRIGSPGAAYLGWGGGGWAAPAGGGFSPEDVAGLSLWLDADDAATITDAGGGAVSQWDDKSGNALHFTQATSANRPLTGTATMNGLNTILFDGTDDFLIRSGVTLAQPFTWFVVAELLNADFSRRCLLTQSVASPPFLEKNNATARMRINSGVALTETSSQVLQDPFIVRAAFNGASSAVGVNNDTDATGNAGATELSNDFVTLSRSAAAWDDKIAEVLVYDSSIISGADYDNIMGYLADKWGITLA